MLSCELLHGLTAAVFPLLQAQDARVVSDQPGQAGRLYTPTRTELFHGPWAEDAVLKYMRQG